MMATANAQALLVTLERVLSETGIALILLDSEGGIRQWGQTAVDLLGFGESQVVGRQIYDVLPDACHGEFRKMLGKVARGRRVGAFLASLQHRDGKQLQVRVTNAPSDTESRRPEAVYLMLQDLTASLQAQAELRQSSLQVRALFQTVPDAIIVINASGIVESMNPAAERMFRCIGHQLIGRSAELFVPEQIRASAGKSIAQFMQDDMHRFVGRQHEVLACDQSGNTFPVDLTIAEVEAEGQRSYVGVLRDISDRKAQEAQLRELNQNLAKEVEERKVTNDSLAQALEELRAAQEHLVQSEKMAALGGMVAGVAHEINTPLGVSITASSVLAEKTRQFLQAVEADEADATVTRRYAKVAGESVRILENNLHRAANLVSSFKQTAVDQSSDHKRRFHVAELIDEVLTSLRPKLKPSGHQVEVDCAPEIEVLARAGDIVQMLTNFIFNSMAHAYDDGQRGLLRIHAHVEDQQLVLAYSDDGKGMDAAHQKQVFDPFFTTRRGSGGSGLGMHIVYNLARRDGGRIDLKSAPGEGSTFTVCLPVEVIRAGGSQP